MGKINIYIYRKELGQFSELAPKAGTDGSHEQVRTAQHWFTLGPTAQAALVIIK
jgi:hypothetical protein